MTGATMTGAGPSGYAAFSPVPSRLGAVPPVARPRADSPSLTVRCLVAPQPLPTKVIFERHTEGG